MHRLAFKSTSLDQRDRRLCGDALLSQ